MLNANKSFPYGTNFLKKSKGMAHSSTRHDPPYFHIVKKENMTFLLKLNVQYIQWCIFNISIITM